MGKVKLAGPAPFGVFSTKPRHYLEMAQIAWRNRGKWRYAWRLLNEGVCDGCALGTSGLRDWTLDGTHLCLVRLNLLELNTMDAFAPELVADTSRLPRRARELRELGRIPVPLRRRAGEAGFSPVSWDEALREIGGRLRKSDPDRIACYMTSRGITNEVYYAAQKAWRLLGSPHIDNAARLCHSPSTAAMKQVLGVGASTCSYRDWYGTDVIVFFGSNPANDQPVALKYLYDAKKLGTRVLVVNTYEEPGMKRYWIPSNADSALFGTAVADRFFHVTAGGDLAFVYAVTKIQEAVYILPAKTRYESLGGVTETTTERRVVFSPYIPGHEIGEAREEWGIVRDLAHAAWPERAHLLEFPDALSIRADIAKTIPFYAPITTLMKKGDQFQWGGPRLCETGAFPRPSRKARFVTAEPPERCRAEPDELYVTTRRGKQFNSIVQNEVDQLTGAARNHVFISPEDMTRLGLRSNQPIELFNAHGVFRGRAFEAKLTLGNIQLHWPEANVLLDPEHIDPGGKVPDYGARVRVRAL